ncbi:FtsW/RodA/SpoVE family cell cycle protein, partial [Anaerotruncus colihominis]|uniref:FtsW/RodA/SpoVE family cell cycle protein n=1 Tax=Anaerotruncus colihominis TaxID=169435 RepID=UPI00210E7D7F|nr:FtsW/RodA/SpoVE family cell cycle protein [Anaerotruncus colihominis]
MFAMIAGQSIVNIGMNLTVLPVIGITLPFLSYGSGKQTAQPFSEGSKNERQNREEKRWRIIRQSSLTNLCTAWGFRLPYSLKSSIRRRSM